MHIFSVAIKSSKNFDEIKIFQRNPLFFGDFWENLGDFGNFRAIIILRVSNKTSFDDGITITMNVIVNIASHRNNIRLDSCAEA